MRAPHLVSGRSVAFDLARPHGCAPHLTLVQEAEPPESEPTDPEQELNASTGRRVRNALEAVHALDPHWRQPDQLTGLDASGQPIPADEQKNAEELIAAARARIDEIRRQRADFPGEPVFDRSNLEDKLTKYALSEKKGQSKGKAFLLKRVFGFNQTNWKELADQIYFDQKIAEPYQAADAHGQRYREFLPIRGANGHTETVRFGFIKDPAGVVRLTTVYLKGK